MFESLWFIGGVTVGAITLIGLLLFLTKETRTPELRDALDAIKTINAVEPLFILQTEESQWLLFWRREPWQVRILYEKPPIECTDYDECLNIWLDHHAFCLHFLRGEPICLPGDMILQKSIASAVDALVLIQERLHAWRIRNGKQS